MRAMTCGSELMGKALFAMVEQLIAEIFFEIDIASQQKGHELFGKVRLVMKGMEFLKKHGVEFNTLTVVHKYNFVINII